MRNFRGQPVPTGDGDWDVVYDEEEDDEWNEVEAVFEDELETVFNQGAVFEVEDEDEGDFIFHVPAAAVIRRFTRQVVLEEEDEDDEDTWDIREVLDSSSNSSSDEWIDEDSQGEEEEDLQQNEEGGGGDQGSGTREGEINFTSPQRIGGDGDVPDASTRLSSFVDSLLTDRDSLFAAFCDQVRRAGMNRDRREEGEGGEPSPCTSNSTVMNPNAPTSRAADNKCGENMEDENVIQLRRTPAKTNLHDSEKEEETESSEVGSSTCNPMVSSEEEEGEPDALRGDRIGQTTYSERHVLKILMKWVEQLPNYSGEPNKEEVAGNGAGDMGHVDKTRFLEPDFEEEMALLWDMSYEPDVMNFLVEHNTFSIIRETIRESACDRLTEIALGIMANILSQQSIVDDFSVHDASLKLVEAVVILLDSRAPRASVLIQVFSVLRRITWFLRNVAVKEGWMELFLGQEFLDGANFILKSSTNPLLLGNVIITIFSILEALGPPKDEEEDEENLNSSYFGSALEDNNKDERFEPFCQNNFVPSLCEGMTELIKDPKPRKTRKMTSTRDRDNQNDDHDGDGDKDCFDDFDFPIPEGHVQVAILNGVSSLFLLYKTPNGKESLRGNLTQVSSILLTVLEKFSVILHLPEESRGSKMDYFAITLKLMSFCHRHKTENVFSPEMTKAVIKTAMKLLEETNEEYKTDDYNESSPHTFIPLVVHEHLTSLGDRFGIEEINTFKTAIQRDDKSMGNFILKMDKVVNHLASQKDANTSDNINNIN